MAWKKAEDIKVGDMVKFGSSDRWVRIEHLEWVVNKKLGRFLIVSGRGTVGSEIGMSIFDGAEVMEVEANGATG